MAVRGLTFALVLTVHGPRFTVHAAEQRLPSVFRGIVVTDSPLGVRVVSVEEASQAYLADLRPEDYVVRVDGREIHSIEEFAGLSNAFKGRRRVTTLLIFRSGQPRELRLHLFSYPILNRWGIEFIPDYDLRFAEARTGFDYWTRLGRGFEEARKPEEALNAYLNGLHNVPDDVPTAVKASRLFLQASERRFNERALREGVGSLSQGVTLMERVFSHNESLTDAQLRAIRDQLHRTLEAMKRSAKPASR